jgi:hypothetical protein
VSVNTYAAEARPCVRREREAVEAKMEAVDEFTDRVRDLSVEPSPGSTPGVTATAGTRASRPGDDRCRAIRRAFAETIRPHSVDVADADTEPLLETVRAELSDSIAVALGPTTDASFSPGLKQAVVSAATARRIELTALDRALDREEAFLDDAQSTVDSVTDWLVDADETPLSALGFDALREYHGTLESHRERCSTLADRRQAFLGGATERKAQARIDHRTLVGYLYDDFAVDHPVLATVARLDSVCAACQRTVRDHLVRRA